MNIEKTFNTPTVIISEDECTLEIKGDSYGSGITEIYKKVIDRIDTVLSDLNKELSCTFHFRVLNSISVKYIILIFSKLNELHKKGKKIKIVWMYESGDTDIAEVVNDLNDYYDLSIEMIGC